MIGIYLLAALLTQFSQVLPAPDRTPLTITASFGELKGVGVGTTVLANGDVVGTVSSVVSEPSLSGSFHLQLKIEPQYHAALDGGIVALISTPLLTARHEKRPVVELIHARRSGTYLRDGMVIRGFDSFEKFWAS